MDHSSEKSPLEGWKLALAALGIIYGDIGTSPLYALKACMAAAPVADRAEIILGTLSLIFWALMLTVSLKYVAFITRADNAGEGGIFALLALLPKGAVKGVRFSPAITVLTLAGASLLFGDGLITPAISVLSAAEGLKTIHPGFEGWVIPIACLILGALFYLQHMGTGRIGGVFGPIMFLWFATLALLGARQIADSTSVLLAINPLPGLRLLADYPRHAFALLGGVVLTITGAEALYADLGHFGRRAIVRGWYGVVLPSLVLNYFGQGAWALNHPQDLTNPFFALAPPGLFQLGLVVLSIVATVIASQALISGTFSLTRQAIQLGYLPRMQVLHTSSEHEGQIYLKVVNTFLAMGCIALVLGFGSSDRLAAAYGIAVTGAMAVTTFVFYRVSRSVWKWSVWRAAPLCAIFLGTDLFFFGSNLPKIRDGGWLPLAVGALLWTIMSTWRKGRLEVFKCLQRSNIDPSFILENLKTEGIQRVPGSAVFMAADPNGTPVALLHHLRINRCLHQTVVLLSLVVEPVPKVPFEKRLETHHCGPGMWRATARYGYMESPNAPAIVELLEKGGVDLDPKSTTYFFNREIAFADGRARMPRWQKSLYAFLYRNARPPSSYFDIPANQIIELGLAVSL